MLPRLAEAGTAAHSASRWVLLKTRFCYTLPSGLILSNFTQELTVSPGFGKEGRSAFLVARCSATIPAAHLCITTPCTQHRPCIRIDAPFRAAAASGCAFSLPTSVLCNNLGDTLAGIYPQFLSARILLDSTDPHPSASIVQPLGESKRYSSVTLDGPRNFSAQN